MCHSRLLMVLMRRRWSGRQDLARRCADVGDIGQGLIAEAVLGEHGDRGLAVQRAIEALGKGELLSSFSSGWSRKTSTAYSSMPARSCASVSGSIKVRRLIVEVPVTSAPSTEGVSRMCGVMVGVVFGYVFMNT